MYHNTNFLATKTVTATNVVSTTITATSKTAEDKTTCTLPKGDGELKFFQF